MPLFVVFMRQILWEAAVTKLNADASTDPLKNEIKVKAYPKRKKPNALHLYSGFDYKLLEAQWEQTDVEIV
jgi:hypothetical protein